MLILIHVLHVYYSYMFKMCYMKYFMFYVYYCTNCAVMFTYSSKMSDISTAGKRGRVWECCLCHLRGEKHYVLRHVFSKHLTFDEWPYSCPVCQYCHYDYTNFRKHPQWYSLHTALKGTSAVPLPSSAEVREESKVVYSMTRQLSIEDSADHWKRRQRAPPMVRPSTKFAASIQILPTPTSSSGLSAVVPCAVPMVAPATPVLADTSGGMAAMLPVSNAAVPVVRLPSSSASAVSAVPLAKEDVEVLSEFLNFEDMTEFDADPLPLRKDAATNTTPRRDEVSRLQEIVARQERAMKNNTQVIMDLQRLLREKLEDPSSRSIHNGLGEGERPQVERRARSPPPPAVKSVVYRPAKQRPRPRSPPRASPLTNLFSPDRKRNKRL